MEQKTKPFKVLQPFIVNGKLIRPVPDKILSICYSHIRPEFCNSLVRQYMKKGYLSPLQWEWVDTIIDAKYSFETD